MEPKSIRTIIGAIILILISHLILMNILNESILRPLPSIDDTPADTVSDAGTDLSGVKQDLMDFINKKFHSRLNDPHRVVKESNYYSTNMIEQKPASHIPEKTDLSKYFNSINPDTKYMLPEMSKAHNYGDPTYHMKELPAPDKDTAGNPLFYNVGSGGKLAHAPDMWRYPMEKVMNGGMIDGVSGYDTMGEYNMAI